MNKRMVSFFTLIVFIVFTFSCYSTKVKTIESVESSWNGKKGKILNVLKTSGEQIEFSKKKPGRIEGDKIVGIVYDGLREKRVSIPLSEVELVRVRQFSMGKTYLILIGVILGGLIAQFVHSVRNASCPFIYSFDGENYIFDAEPYGGAVCRVLKRTDCCCLRYLQEVKGEYKILVTNELDETEYIDELKLLVVDHPVSVQVFPDLSGGIHTISNPIIPVRVYDQKGNDLSSYVCEDDWIFWHSRDREKNPDRKEDLRDTLIFEFPKPKNACKAKLLFNGCSTWGGAKMLTRYLELYGNRVFKWYDEMNTFGPAFFRMVSTDLREELYSLQIRVETEKGWKSKGVILSAPPLTPKNKVYTLNLEDVPGDTLKIKLTPPAAFWKINYIAIDYTADLPVKITEIKAIKATDNKGQEVGELLAANDDNYLVMPNIRDSAELIFKSPARSKSMERTVILKAGGYYDIHLKAEGEPQLEILDRIHSEPGFAVRYALKWMGEKSGGQNE